MRRSSSNASMPITTPTMPPLLRAADIERAQGAPGDEVAPAGERGPVDDGESALVAREREPEHADVAAGPFCEQAARDPKRCRWRLRPSVP